MNERIKELFLKSGGRLSLDVNGSPYQFEQEELEKFAELIVNECISIAKVSERHNVLGWYEIKKHFGA
jgi:hypothetical protein